MTELKDKKSFNSRRLDGSERTSFFIPDPILEVTGLVVEEQV